MGNHGQTEGGGAFSLLATADKPHVSLTGTRSHGDRLWLLVNLELWLRMAIDGEEPQPLERRMERVAVSV